MTSTHKHNIISIQYPSHKCLPEKSCLHCLRILIMSCLRIQLTVAWLNLTMPNQTVKNGLKAKKIKLPQMSFFYQKTNTNNIFMYLLAPLVLQNFKKILRADPELWQCAIFRPKMAHLSWTKIFRYKPLLLSSTYWPFHCQKFKKIQIQSYEDAPFLGSKWSICPKQFFFLKIINIILI